VKFGAKIDHGHTRTYKMTRVRNFQVLPYKAKAGLQKICTALYESFSDDDDIRTI
jgi:hypothetical protein